MKIVFFDTLKIGINIARNGVLKKIMKQNIFIFSLLLLNAATFLASDKRPSEIQTPKAPVSDGFWSTTPGIDERKQRKAKLESIKMSPYLREMAIKMALLTGTEANLDVLRYADDELNDQVVVAQPQAAVARERQSQTFVKARL